MILTNSFAVEASFCKMKDIITKSRGRNGGSWGSKRKQINKLTLQTIQHEKNTHIPRQQEVKAHKICSSVCTHEKIVQIYSSFCVRIKNVYKWPHLSVCAGKCVELYSQKLTWTPEPLCGSPAVRFHLHSNEPGTMNGFVLHHWAAKILKVFKGCVCDATKLKGV